MNCNEFEIHVSDFLDGTLHGDALAGFELHRVQCPLCAMLLDSVNDSLSRLHQLDEVEPPPGLAERILAATSGGRASLGRRLLGFVRFERELAPQLMAASVLILFAAALSYNMFIRPPDTVAGASQPANLVTVVDYTGNRLLSSMMQFYSGVQDTWETAGNYYDKTADFFQTSWQQVKDAFKGKDEKKKPVPDSQKNINQSMQAVHDFDATA
ncbi:MAG TPA: hypothetical protein PKN61_13440 [Acidobacteriota bacterium]|jgi:hypothetical protein|nr:hypothetical protein [Acidobacteriota bacterium]HNR40032.1 hypothetical protein [Acidobacteriota bacterium]HNT99877.1 hypothetical protein [Acidobacteriota bacterium]HQO27023.1 hypothetical protein [Acidobacteriota bacterium]